MKLMEKSKWFIFEGEKYADAKSLCDIFDRIIFQNSKIL